MHPMCIYCTSIGLNVALHVITFLIDRLESLNFLNMMSGHPHTHTHTRWRRRPTYRLDRSPRRGASGEGWTPVPSRVQPVLLRECPIIARGSNGIGEKRNITWGELQLLWTDRVSDQTLVSLRLYFLPENTPEGRNLHGEVDDKRCTNVPSFWLVGRVRGHISQTNPVALTRLDTFSKECVVSIPNCRIALKWAVK
ncbi:AT-rich interactive domain-containing protein 5B [Eumeta japonica]|uniref:AT-rich interactive domain-containing protein 5B n=1 Tax=Eumeta variegata TaxID=151549 RepID=A0A4C1XL54_EUMVA|nr:AT-rich interactive domain-containing protein 5B [Eumeta japonica]